MAKLANAYLKQNRLSDVLSAIQAMAIYKFYKLDFAGWSDRISGDSEKADHWRSVFEEHPEFFRLDSSRQKASLVLRRQKPKRFDVDKQAIISSAEFYAHPQKDRVSRAPLQENEVMVLLSTAISLHERALSQSAHNRWIVEQIRISIMGLVPIITFLAGVYLVG
ncbi:MAG: N-carbamoyl-L-amino acid amidohydrolase [Alphaproteobacteria bacterium]|nr:N-carbamoyl-L-amino acid amidohydrolase [Alphaproteobacteria bacterium]